MSFIDTVERITDEEWDRRERKFHKKRNKLKGAYRNSIEGVLDNKKTDSKNAESLLKMLDSMYDSLTPDGPCIFGGGCFSEFHDAAAKKGNYPTKEDIYGTVISYAQKEIKCKNHEHGVKKAGKLLEDYRVVLRSALEGMPLYPTDERIDKFRGFLDYLCEEKNDT